MRPLVTVLVIAAAALLGAGAYFMVVVDEDAAEARDGVAAPSRSATPHGGAPRLPASTAAPLDCARPTGTAAIVGDARIEVERLCATVAQLGGVKDGGVDRALARIVLDRLIDAEVVRAATRRSASSVTEADLDAWLDARGIESTPLVRAQLRERLELERLAGVVAVSDADVDAEVAAGAPGIDRGGGVKVEGWLVRVAPGADAEARASAEARARVLANLLAAKAPEAAVAGHGATKLAPFVVAATGLEPALEAAIAGLAPGETSGAIETKVGWTIVRVLGHEPGTQLDDRALRERVRAALETRRNAAAATAKLTTLRNAARIEILVEI